MEGELSLYGCLLGIAVGDSIGLPFEGLNNQRIARRLRSKPLSQSLVFGRGMLSDDTEQSCLVLEAAVLAKGDPILFQKLFSRKLLAWFLALPAGVGLATVRACLRLLVGVSPARSGVKSAGNGSAMRAPVLGVIFANDPKARRAFADASSVVTHSDQRAIDGARVMVESVSLSQHFVNQSISRKSLIDHLVHQCESNEWKEVLEKLRKTSDVNELAESIGARGKVTGYVMQSVPIAVSIWLSEPQNPRKGLETAIRLGGDTDTVGAMIGALYGASLGPEAFPTEWREKIRDFPRSQQFLKNLAQAIPGKAPRALWPFCLIRNLVFLIVVLAHGLRRLLP